MTATSGVPRRLLLLLLGVVLAAGGCSANAAEAGNNGYVAASGRAATPACPLAPTRPRHGGNLPIRTGPAITYGHDAGLALTATLTRPAGTGRWPAVLIVHGGSWMHGSPAQMAGIARSVARGGFVAVNVTYRLATPGRGGFPGELADLRQAVRFLRAHAAAYRIDPQRIGALGSSAGANLVLLLARATAGHCASGAGVAAVVAWSAPIDLASYGDFAARHCPTDLDSCPGLDRMAVQYVGCSYRRCPHRYVQASPDTGVTPGFPPTLLFNSTRELIPLRQAVEMARALARSRVEYRLVVLRGDRHAQAYAGAALERSLAFLHDHLG